MQARPWEEAESRAAASYPFAFRDTKTEDPQAVLSGTSLSCREQPFVAL
jgi:hypothetical protein